MTHIGAKRRAAWRKQGGVWLYCVNLWENGREMREIGPRTYYVQRDIGMEHKTYRQWLRLTSEYLAP